MFTFPRLMARQFRTLVRKAVLAGSTRSLPPPLVFRAARDGLHLHCQAAGLALDVVVPGRPPPGELALPLAVLDACEGADSTTVEVVPRSGDQAELRWQQGRLPQVRLLATEPLPKEPPPALPTRWQDAPAHFLAALDQAVQSAAKQAGRYALDHFLLDGDRQTLTATDGRHLLVQDGCRCPWSGSVLIPRLPIFGCREWREARPVRLGRADTHVVMQAGPWTLHLPVAKDARFPPFDQVIPRRDQIRTTLTVDAADAAFLAGVLPQLPGHHEENAPVTLDLDGRSVAVRARESGQPYGSEVVLSRSHTTGAPVRLALCRDLLRRALALGLRTFQIVAADKALLAEDAGRQFVAMTLSADAVLAPQEGDLRLASQEGRRTTRPKTVIHTSAIPVPAIPERNPTMPQRLPGSAHLRNGHTPAPVAAPLPAAPTPPHGGYAAILAEAQAVQATVRDALARVNSLLAALKQHRRQARAVQSSLLALRELQTVDA